MWTFGKKIAAGFAIAFATLVAVGGIAYRAIESLTTTSYSVTHTRQVLEHILEAQSLLKDAETGQRGFVLTGNELFLEPHTAALPRIELLMRELRDLTRDNPRQQKLLDDVEPIINEKVTELKRTIVMRRSDGFEAVQKVIAVGHGKALMDTIRKHFALMEEEERELLRQRAAEVEQAASGGRLTILFGTLFCAFIVIGAGYSITRALTSQIGHAVQHVQSSSAELQTAANQQASGAKESSAAMSEIVTTINELLATSRQIAESARRVAQVAQDTSSAARAGDQNAQRAHESVSGIKRQVDQIVTHMLDLGKKSQQIGGILDIINELSEQTNILSINASIEAAGAGELGKRFGVVADEIRKLADRVGGSAKEIRALIDEIRAAVNTTVMATEGGSKAVDLGTRQFADVTQSLGQIASLVSTTSQAAREIELSTKQQSTAVEQVNTAISSVAQATRESEASSTQTLQTATQLTTLSRELTRMIQAPAVAA